MEFDSMKGLKYFWKCKFRGGGGRGGEEKQQAQISRTYCKQWFCLAKLVQDGDYQTKKWMQVKYFWETFGIRGIFGKLSGQFKNRTLKSSRLPEVLPHYEKITRRKHSKKYSRSSNKAGTPKPSKQGVHGSHLSHLQKWCYTNTC